MEIYGNKIDCEPSDLSYIQEQLARLPYKQLMKGVTNKYSQVYLKHDGSLQGMGEARRNANNRLREYIDILVESQK